MTKSQNIFTYVENAIKTDKISSLMSEPDEILRKEYARLYFLLTKKNLPDVAPESYGFSIQELLDHTIIDQNVIDRVGEDSRVYLSGLRINNLYGLHTIPKIELADVIILDHNQLTAIDEESFKGLVRLKFLSLHDNRIATIAPRSLSSLSNLHFLFLFNNELNTISDQDFSGLSNLRRLLLGWNKLVTISAGAFNDLTNLKTLSLGHNNLSTLTPKVFNGLSNLEVLELNNNKLRSINFEVFRELIHLQQLYLEVNELTTIDESMIGYFANLKLIELRSNPLSQETKAKMRDRMVNSNGNCLML